MKGYYKVAWTLPRYNINLGGNFGTQPLIAIVAAISRKHGLICELARYKSIRKEDFKEFLKLVLKRVPPKSAVLLLDNCSVHHSKLITQYLTGKAERCI